MIPRIALLLLTLVAAPLAAEESSQDDLLARVGDEEIRYWDLVTYARKNPFLSSRLRTLGGARPVLDDMIYSRLLAKEGERLGVPRPSEERGGDAAYVLDMKRRLVEPCAEPTSKDVREYYESHLHAYSTPLYLRLSRIGIAPRDGDTETARARLRDIQTQIAAGDLGFEQAADQYSEDSYGKGRGGDIGFVEALPGDTVTQELSAATLGALLGPMMQGDAVYLYKVTARREPILAPFEEVSAQVSKDLNAACAKANFAEAIAPLKERWPVEVFLKD